MAAHRGERLYTSILLGLVKFVRQLDEVEAEYFEHVFTRLLFLLDDGRLGRSLLHSSALARGR